MEARVVLVLTVHILGQVFGHAPITTRPLVASAEVYGKEVNYIWDENQTVSYTTEENVNSTTTPLSQRKYIKRDAFYVPTSAKRNDVAADVPDYITDKPRSSFTNYRSLNDINIVLNSHESNDHRKNNDTISTPQQVLYPDGSMEKNAYHETSSEIVKMTSNLSLDESSTDEDQINNGKKFTTISLPNDSIILKFPDEILQNYTLFSLPNDSVIMKFPDKISQDDIISFESSLSSWKNNSNENDVTKQTIIANSVIVSATKNSELSPKSTSSIRIRTNDGVPIHQIEFLANPVRVSAMDAYKLSHSARNNEIEDQESFRKFDHSLENIETDIIDESDSPVSYDQYYDEDKTEIDQYPIPPPPAPCNSRTCVRKCCLQNQTLSFFLPKIGCVPREAFDPLFELPEFHQKTGEVANSLSNVEMAYGGLDCRYGPVDTDQVHYILPTGNLYNSETDVEYGLHSYCMELVKLESDKLQLEMISCFEPAKPSTYHLVRMRTMPVLMFISIVSLVILISCYAMVPDLRDMQGLCLLNYALCMLLGGCLAFSIHVVPNTIPFNACVTIGLLIHVIFIAAFLWLTVMCYDGRRFIRARLAMLSRDAEEDRSYYRRYCVFAWGGALLLGAVSLTMQLLPEDALPPWVVRPEYGRTRCFIHDATPNLFFYHFIIVGTLFFANVLFLGHTCYLLYQQGVAFTFVTKIKETKFSSLLKNRCQTSQDDSVFDSSASCRTDTSSIYSRIFPAFQSWCLTKTASCDKTREGSEESLDTSSTCTASETTSTGRRSLGSISQTDETAAQDVVTPPDAEDVLQGKIDSRQKINKKDCNIKDMGQKGTNLRGPSYVADFWQRFQLLVLIALCWTTEVMSFVIPPKEMWIVTDMLNVLQGFWVLVLFLKYDKTRVKVKTALRQLSERCCGCCRQRATDSSKNAPLV